jgi:hypothetical protein
LHKENVSKLQELIDSADNLLNTSRRQIATMDDLLRDGVAKRDTRRSRDASRNSSSSSVSGMRQLP